jgi:cbb3-type cytochrome c oxidase subunit III
MAGILMNMNLEKKYIRIYRVLTIIFSSLLIILILSAWIGENFFREWKKYQSEFKKIIEAGKTKDLAEQDLLKIEIGIRQLELENLNRVDRCISCHLGIENPEMINVQQPHTAHSGNYLINHPVHKYGCTICHGGQGRALEKEDAFGRTENAYWLFPLLDQPYIQASCGKCHLILFGEGHKLAETEIFIKGQQIFNREGCLGCHQARGVGGTVGPDLTEQGEKTRHEYNFQNVRGEQTVSNWLKEHFRDPEIVSPGSQMLRMSLNEEEIEALVTFTLGLAKPDIPFEYFSVETLNEHKGARNIIKGNNLYQYCCSACHGKKREGKNYKEYETGVPALSNRDFLSVASSSLIRFTIVNGRSWRQMASWLPEFSGLGETEIDSVVNFIRNAKETNSSFNSTIRIDGSFRNGSDVYNSKCSMCHGMNGEGVIALPLNNYDFLKVASDRFIYSTVNNGRYNTAMPSWSYLTDEEMSDLIAFIRSWGIRYNPSVQQTLIEGDTQQGAIQFHYLCSRCHGEYGEGETGPAILNSDFLRTADDIFLYQTVAYGRIHTAMFGWKGQVTQQGEIGDRQIKDIITFMRSVQDTTWDYIFPGANPGNAQEGNKLFSSNCAVCHGENGSGANAPQLNNQEFLNAATNGYIIATISLGRNGTDMPSWGTGSDQYPELTGKERQDIAALIRSWQKIQIKGR